MNERQLNNRGLMLGMVALGLIFGAGGMYIADQMAPSGLGGADRARVEQVVHDYVLANPEIIPEAMQKLQDKQFSKVVQDNRTGKVSYWQKEYHQSAGDADGVSTADYIHAMFAFLRQAGSKNVLIIGCGGGTLATMLVSLFTVRLSTRAGARPFGGTRWRKGPSESKGKCFL